MKGKKVVFFEGWFQLFVFPRFFLWCLFLNYLNALVIRYIKIFIPLTVNLLCNVFFYNRSLWCLLFSPQKMSQIYGAFPLFFSCPENVWRETTKNFLSCAKVTVMHTLYCLHQVFLAVVVNSHGNNPFLHHDTGSNNIAALFICFSSRSLYRCVP